METESEGGDITSRFPFIKTFTRKVKNLADTKGSLLFVFDPTQQRVTVKRFQTVLTYGPTYTEGTEVYRPVTPIIGDPRLMRINENTVKAAIVTEVALYVMDMPHVGQCLLLPPPLNNTTDCQVWMVQPHVQLPKAHYSVLQVRWHTTNVYHLVVLYNDNYLRLMNADTNIIDTEVFVGPHLNYQGYPNVDMSENVVDFDFIREFPIKRKTEDSCPRGVIMVKRNGEILYAEMAKEYSYVQGPLEVKLNNWRNKCIGLMKWSIMVLATEVPTVVIISGNQILHMVMITGRNGVKSLIPIESICLTDRNDVNYNKILIKDPGCVSRYFIVRPKGIFAVNTNLVEKVKKLLEKNNVHHLDQECINEVLNDTTSLPRVDYLYYNEMNSIIDPLRVLGLGLIPQRRSCMGVVVQFDDQLANLNFMLGHLPQYTQEPIQQNDPVEYCMERPDDITTNVLTTEKHINDAEEYLKLMMNQIPVFKQYNLYQNNELCAAIKNGVKTLRTKFRIQKEELDQLRMVKATLQSNAEHIAEQFEETNERQDDLLLRAQNIALKVINIAKSLPEYRMRCDLLKYKKLAEELKTSIQKAEAQVAILSKEQPVWDRPIGNTNMPFDIDARKKVLYESLLKMNREIAAMDSNVRNILGELQSYVGN